MALAFCLRPAARRARHQRSDVGVAGDGRARHAAEALRPSRPLRVRTAGLEPALRHSEPDERPRRQAAHCGTARCFFAEGTTPHLCLNAEHLRHARPAGGREAAPVRWAAWAAAAAGRRRARAPASALRSVRHPKLHTSPEKNTVCHITLITQVESNIGEICLCVSTRTSFSNMLLIEREKNWARPGVFGRLPPGAQGGAPL